MPKLGLDRQQLAQFLPNAEAIRAFEKVFDSVNTTPATIEEAATLAGTAAAIANLALSILGDYSELLNRLNMAPAPSVTQESDDFIPAPAPSIAGTLAEQDANAVVITGGTIDGTIIGGSTPAAGTFTTVNKITFTQPAAAATFTLANNKTFTVSNTLTLTATDGSTLAIGAGGTLGSAAYTSSGTYALLAGSTSQAFSTAALTSLTADLAVTASIRGASGRLQIYGYYDATNGVIINAKNNALSDYIPLNFESDKVSFYAPNGAFFTNKLGYNGKTGEALQTAPAAATDLPTSITAINNIIARLTALGTYT